MTKFNATCGERPISLNETTRALCEKALTGYFGKRIIKNAMAVSLDDVDGIESMNHIEKYNVALERIVKNCPIYVNDDELLVGSASLGAGIIPVLPATYKGNYIAGWGINHVTYGFMDAINNGMDSYRDRILKSMLKHPDRKVYLNSLLHCLDCYKIWHSRYIDELDRLISLSPDDKRLKDIKENLEVVPFNKPKTFYQALQSLWFNFAYARLVASWPGLGRIDQILWPYLEDDLKNNRTTMKQVKEYVAHFFIKGCEWINHSMHWSSGDADHFQNIVLGGIDETGKDITNPVTHMVLEVVAEFPIGDYPIAVRVNSQTPDSIYELIALNTSLGGGVVGIYDEGTVIKMLLNYGYSFKEAVKFTNDGCWEIQVPGSTHFTYSPFDGYSVLQKNVLGLGEPDAKCIIQSKDTVRPINTSAQQHTSSYSTFEQLCCAFKDALTSTVLTIREAIIAGWDPQKKHSCIALCRYTYRKLY